MEQIVVVGGGLAGLRTITELRSRGYPGRLVLLGAERHLPYDRPPLSKAYLLSDDPPDPGLEADWAALDVEVRLGTPATGLTEGVVETAAGPVAYDRAVIATGSRPVRLPGDPAQRVLRNRDDAADLRAALLARHRIVIVGAGWIGGEVATAAARRGCRVTVIEAGPAPVSTVLPLEIGAAVARWYPEHGIDLRVSSPVSAVEPDGAVLATGERVAGDLVLVGVGVRPATDWLAGSTVPLDNGVLVGPDLGAIPGVWAVGDAAARWSPRYGRRIRGEHWDDALNAPSVLAANLLGGEHPYDPVPYVWSEQFGHLLQWVGTDDGADTTIWRGDPADSRSSHPGKGWAVVWLRAGRILGLLAVDRPRDAVQGRRLAARDAVVDPDRIADPEVAIKDCVAS